MNRREALEGSSSTGLPGLADEGVEHESTRYIRTSSLPDVKLDRPLRELDPVRLKYEIRRWARAVVRYARHLSRSFSSTSFSRRGGSDRRDQDGSA